MSNPTFQTVYYPSKFRRENALQNNEQICFSSCNVMRKIMGQDMDAFVKTWLFSGYNCAIVSQEVSGNWQSLKFSVLVNRFSV